MVTKKQLEEWRGLASEDVRGPACAESFIERAKVALVGLLGAFDMMVRAADCGAQTDDEGDDEGRIKCRLQGGFCHRCHMAGIVEERNTAQDQLQYWRTRAERAEADGGAK